jgi:hypothetical protein
MANPSHWVFRRGQKWHSGWRDENGHCRSKAHPPGAGKALASDYARKMALEACQVRAGQPVGGKDIRLALEAFLSREDVKTGTHGLNRRHLEAVINHHGLETVEQLTEDLLHDWLRHLKSLGYNPGGQSLSLRILRTFCRFCFKKKWLALYPFGEFKIPKSEFVGATLARKSGRSFFPSIRDTRWIGI